MHPLITYPILLIACMNSCQAGWVLSLPHYLLQQITKRVWFHFAFTQNLFQWCHTNTHMHVFSLTFTESLTWVDMFNSLRAQGRYNDLLLFVMWILIMTGISLHIFTSPSVDNITADTLSQNLTGTTSSTLPGLHIHPFQHPHRFWGQGWCFWPPPNSGNPTGWPGHTNIFSVNVQ